jgi:membrane-associated phospholipid phosphatase
MGLLQRAALAATLAGLTAPAVVPDALAREVDEKPWPSIYRISPLVDALVIGAGALGGGLPYLWRDDLVGQDCPCDRNEVNPFDRRVIGNYSQVIANASDVSLVLALALPLLANYLVLDDGSVWLEDAVVFTQAVTTNLLLTAVAKFVVQRPQPTVYEPGGPRVTGDAMMYLSFYSGHTSVVFTALSAASFTVGKRYGRWALPWLVTLVYGAGVGAQLVLSGGHFPTDVIVGAAAGTLVGTVVPWLHLRPERRLGLLPWGVTRGGGLAIHGLL